MANLMLGRWYKLYTKQTPAELAFENIISKFGIRYRTQHIILAASAFPDFFLPDYNLVIEVDDKSHFEKAKIQKDRERTKRLNGLGINVIRFTNEEVLETPMVVLKAVRAVLDSYDVQSRTPTKPTVQLPKKRGRPRKQSQDVVSRLVFDSPD